MTRAALGCSLLFVLIAGCPAEPAPVQIELINQTGLNVTPNLYVSATAEDSAGLFVAGNLRTDFTDRPIRELRPSESASLTIECGDISSAGVAFPIAFDPVTLTVRTSTESVFLLRDVDFACEKTIRFAFFREGEAIRIRTEVFE